MKKAIDWNTVRPALRMISERVEVNVGWAIGPEKVKLYTLAGN